METITKKKLSNYTIIFCIIYWILESIIHLLFLENLTFTQAILPKDNNELIMRFEVIAAITFFAVYLYFSGIKTKELNTLIKDVKIKERLFVNSLPQPIFEIDNKGIIKYINEQAYKQFEYNENDFKNGLSAVDLIVPEEQNKVRENINKILSGEIIKDNNYTGISKTGKRFPIEIYSVPITENDKSKRIRGIVYDMSRIYALESDSKRLMKAVEESPSSIVITNTKGHIEYANKKFFTITGYTAKEVLGKNPRILKSGQTAPEVYQNLWNTITDKKEWHGEFINKKKNGEIYIEDVKIAPIINSYNKIINYIAVKEDITSRKILENALKESENKYRSLFEATPLGIGITVLNGKVVSANPSMLNLTGYSLQELENLNLKDTFVDQDKYYQIQKEILEKGILINSEVQLKRKDNTIYDALLTIKKIEIDGQPAAFTIKQDITIRKNAERQIKKYTRDLEKSNHYKELFIDITRHDLLNLANAIENGTELFINTKDEKEQNEISQLVIEASKQLVDLVKNAAKFSSLEDIKEVEFKTSDLSTLIKSAININEKKAKEKYVNINFNQQDKVMAKVNPLITDVFINIISNAIKYAHEGKIIDININSEKNDYIVSIKDYGKGIPDKYKEIIFERFERHIKDGIEGTGLGLAICKRIVEFHYGKIWVENNPKGGSIFKVKIPKTL
ncbi:MAG: PAS domain-containing sensor histidine kinase [Spirochaetia bacterium]|nr:PAS domain-containing sensor histidine kinase [Spirochaetia bacterium]